MGKHSELIAAAFQALEQLDQLVDLFGNDEEFMATRERLSAAANEAKRSTLFCDRCHAEIDRNSNWGNCTLCGDDLCEKCSGGFNAEGECKKCNGLRID